MGFVVLLAATVALCTVAQRSCGVRISHAGWQTTLVALTLLAAVIVLFSVALGIAASLDPWWVAPPAVAGFAVVLAGSYRFDRLRRRYVRREQ